jgi:SOS-response transcriptional repressor LexA
MATASVQQPSPKQMELLCRLYRFQQKHGYSPTLDELGRMMGISKVTVHQYVRVLEEKGLIRRIKNYARSLQIVDEAKIKPYLRHERPSWKLVGRLNAAGQIKFFANPRKLEPELLFEHYRNANLLHVIGRSWPEKNICDGDYLLIEPLSEKHSKNLALIQIPGGQIELCNLIRRRNQLFVKKNNLLDEIPASRADILAVVIGMLRGY